MATAPDLADLVVVLEGQIIGPRVPGGYLEGCGCLVDFERLHSVAEEDQLVLRQDVQGPDLERRTLERFDDFLWSN